MRQALLVSGVPLTLGCALLAQNPLFAEVNEPLPDGMGQLIASADYEGDGDVDLFTSSGVFLNDCGYFRAGPKLPASAAPTINIRSVAVADFTGDGRVDVLIGRFGGTPAGLALYAAPQAGGAEFVAGATAIGGVIGAQKLAAADFDGDGDVDVCAASSSGGSPLWQLLINDGTGAFAAAGPSQWPVANVAASWVGAADLDGDALLDVIATASTGPVWRRNLGGGAFGVMQALPATLVADWGAVGDFDADGSDDVFVVDVTGNGHVITGSPTGPVVGALTPFGILGTPPLAVDFNDDGMHDIVRSIVDVSGSKRGYLVVRLGSPLGLEPFDVPIGPVEYGFGNPLPWPGMAFADVDGSGTNDLVLAPGAGAPWMVLDAGPAGLAIAEKSVPFAFGSLFAPPADIDGDGDVDLVRALFAGGLVTLESFRNDGRGVLAVDPTPAGSYLALSRVGGDWADLDADGDLDLWVQGLGNGDDDLALLNDGNGVFHVGASVDVPGRTNAIAFGDFDGDQIVDVVLARGLLQVFPPIFQRPVLVRGVPSPAGIAYAAPVPIGAAELVVDIATVDVEGDGDTDLVVATRGVFVSPAQCHIYLNDGTGVFAPQPPFPGVVADAVAVGDLDNDGCDDLVLGGTSWLCQGGGAYALAGSHVPPTGRIALADLDGDGNLDLLDASGQWYAGTGVGTLLAPSVFVPYGVDPVADSNAGPAAVDMDSDGDLDVIGPKATLPGHFTIYSNLTRHAARDTLALAGDSLELSVYGRPSELWALAASLPGIGPVPAIVTAALFVQPLVRTLALQGKVDRVFEKARLDGALEKNGLRESYLRATATGEEEGQRIVTPAASQDSALLSPFSKANVLIRRKAGAPAAASGDEVEIVRLR